MFFEMKAQMNKMIPIINPETESGVAFAVITVSQSPH